MPAVAKPAGERERVALVLAGGGARGAYEAGALAALAPALAAAGETPEIIVGTSIGALNGAFFAARADEPLPDAAAAALAMWQGLRFGDAREKRSARRGGGATDAGHAARATAKA